jgi:hypothetical protein
MAHDFIRVPPDSTGKRVRNERTLDITITDVNLQILNTIQSGTIITSSSGGSGYFNSYKIDSRNVITIYLKDFIGTFLSTNTLTHSGQVFSTISEAYEQYTNKNVISDKENPNNTLRVDGAGAAVVRFTEGNVNLDVFGNLKTTTSTIIKSYVFYYGRNFGDFIDVLSNSGSISVDSPSSQVILNTTSQSGSSAVMTTYNYIPYVPQHSNTIVLSVACGDGGKSGVVRRWGVYDDEDGIYFEQNENGLSVNIKSSITNTVLSVNQSNFNGDMLLSDIFDTFEIDTSKYNLYWMSYQWQGVGVVKFGVYSPMGDRITMHTFNNPNQNVTPYMKRGTLPVRLEQFNNGIVASASELKTSCIVVLRDAFEFTTVGKLQRYTTPQYVTVTNTRTPLISLRVSELVNGQTNRTVIMPFKFEYIVENEPVIIEYIVNGVLVDSNFQPYTAFSEIDVSSTGISGGLSTGIHIVNTGFHLENVPDGLEYAVNNTNIQNVVTIVARTTKPADTASVFLIAKWREVL